MPSSPCAVVTLTTPPADDSRSGSSEPARCSASGITLYGNSGASSKGGRPMSKRAGRNRLRSSSTSPAISRTPRARRRASNSQNSATPRSTSAPPFSTRSPRSTSPCCGAALRSSVKPRCSGVRRSRATALVTTFIVEAGAIEASERWRQERLAWPMGRATAPSASAGRAADASAARTGSGRRCWAKAEDAASPQPSSRPAMRRRDVRKGMAAIVSPGPPALAPRFGGPTMRAVHASRCLPRPARPRP
jgi:hypothetical protein